MTGRGTPEGRVFPETGSLHGHAWSQRGCGAQVGAVHHRPHGERFADAAEYPEASADSLHEGQASAVFRVGFGDLDGGEAQARTGTWPLVQDTDTDHGVSKEGHLQGEKAAFVPRSGVRTGVGGEFSHQQFEEVRFGGREPGHVANPGAGFAYGR